MQKNTINLITIDRQKCIDLLIDNINRPGVSRWTNNARLHAAVKINSSPEMLTELIGKERLDRIEKFIIENGIFSRCLSVGDYLKINHTRWKDDLDPRGLYVILLDLFREGKSEYHDFLRPYLASTNSMPELLNLHATILPHNNLAQPGRPIVVISNCNLQYFARYLELALFADGIATEVKVTDFDNWAVELSDEHSTLNQLGPSLVIFYLSSLGMTKAGSQYGREGIDIFVDAFERYLDRTAGMVLLILPEPLEEEYFAESQAYGWRWRWLAELHSWREKSPHAARVVFCDLTSLIQEVGRTGWYAPRYWYHAKLPCHINAMPSLGRYVFKHTRKLMRQSIKVIVCDLDNTLWGGIVGEVGWQNLDLDPNSSGAAFLRLQSLLRHANDNGVLLAIASKNDEKIVREVFSYRREMLLSWENFTLTRVNWDPKPDNIREMADQLNLGLKHFCFLDDSPFERAAVREGVPEAMVPELPAEPDQYVPYLLDSGLFFFPSSTEVDRMRPALYQAELSRDATRRRSPDYATFLETLAMQLFPDDISEDNIKRCEQLVARTNQFNLTGIRLSLSELESYSRDRTVFSTCYSLRDSIGDSGIIGLIIAVPENSSDYRMICWVMSCRVMGRNVEHAMLSHFLEDLKQKGASTLFAFYKPTTRNGSLAGLLPALGFGPCGGDSNAEGSRFQFNLANPFTWNRGISIMDGDR
jgi:FkbH-like protein